MTAEEFTAEDYRRGRRRPRSRKRRAVAVVLVLYALRRAYRRFMR